MRRHLLIQILLLILVAAKTARAGPYIEAGTSIGKAASADAMAQQGLGTVGTGFVGSLNLYFPLGYGPVHFDLGMQNRFTTLPGSNGSSFLFTPNVAARLEFWRFYVGGGYAPKVLVDFKPYQGSSAFFGEGGIIWRVVPEFQICATLAMEYGMPLSGGRSPSPSSEYGLRFRFPLDPKESGSARGVDYDGYRYPFGIMR